MNKFDMIEAIAKDTNLSKANAKKVIDSIMNNASRALSNNERVKLHGLGSFRVVRRAARAGRNPQTGAVINIPAKNVVRYSQSEQLDVN